MAGIATPLIPADDSRIAELSLMTRLDAAREALKRSRFAFIVATAVSLSVMIAVYNAYFSWYRDFALQQHYATNEVAKYTQQLVIENWLRSQVISVQLLGINVGVSDAAALASLSLFVIALWFYFAVRRENHIIGHLLNDTKDQPPPILDLVFHAIVSNLVFIDIAHGDEPIARLDDRSSHAARLPFVHGAIKALYFLPPFTIWLVFVADLLTIFVMRAAARDYPHAPLLDVLNRHNVPWVIIFELVAFVLGGLTSLMSARINAFENGTRDVLMEYLGLLHELQGGGVGVRERMTSTVGGTMETGRRAVSDTPERADSRTELTSLLGTKRTNAIWAVAALTIVLLMLLVRNSKAVQRALADGQDWYGTLGMDAKVGIMVGGVVLVAVILRMTFRTVTLEATKEGGYKALEQIADSAKWMAGIQVATLTGLGLLVENKPTAAQDFAAIATALWMGAALFCSAWVLTSVPNVALAISAEVEASDPTAAPRSKKFDVYERPLYAGFEKASLRDMLKPITLNFMITLQHWYLGLGLLSFTIFLVHRMPQ